jgi:hypothetical protein
MMNLGRVNYWRNLAGKAGAIFCLIALVAVMDGLLVHFREPDSVVKVLPGAVAEINGELIDEANNIDELTYVSSSGHLKVEFIAIHQGYFMGGDMWRGRLLVGRQISPGEYSLAVLPQRTASPRKAPAFRILVFADGASLRQSSASLIRRWFGVPPLGLAAGCLPGILLAFGAVYWLSGKKETLLAAAGQAEIYRVTRGDGGCEIRFSLGTAQGLSPGANIAIFDGAGRQVGVGTVEASNQTASVAQVTSDQEIKVGYLVRR